MSDLGFMGFWSDIDADYILRYQQWHNCEHVPERVGIPGFIEGRRYRALGPGPMFFMCYVTTGPDVLSSEPYLAALNRPTDWTREALTKFRNPERSLYRRVARSGATPAHTPYIVLARFNDDRPAEAIARSLAMAPDADPAIAGRVSLYDMEIDASRIMTAERRIYSAGPGERRFLASAELTDPAAAERAATRLADLLAPARDLDVAAYWLETRILSADVRPANTSALLEATS
jgi:hypothetical protein